MRRRKERDAADEERRKKLAADRAAAAVAAANAPATDRDRAGSPPPSQKLAALFESTGLTNLSAQEQSDLLMKKGVTLLGLSDSFAGTELSACV